MEVKNGVNAPVSSWGADHAVSAWGSYFRNTYLPLSKWPKFEHLTLRLADPNQSVAERMQSMSFHRLCFDHLFNMVFLLIETVSAPT